MKSASELNQMWQDHAKYKEESAHLVCFDCGAPAHTCHHQFDAATYILQTREEFNRDNNRIFFAMCVIGAISFAAIMLYIFN